jgi:hypothetical protein
LSGPRQKEPDEVAKGLGQHVEKDQPAHLVVLEAPSWLTMSQLHHRSREAAARATYTRGGTQQAERGKGSAQELRGASRRGGRLQDKGPQEDSGADQEHQDMGQGLTVN